MKSPIYLDNQATTPLAPEVFDAMVPWLKDHFGNPHSAHKLGRQTAAIIDVAREQLAVLLPEQGNVIFTGSATEAINLGFGAIYQQLKRGRNEIIVLETEHAAVRDTAKSYAKIGFEVAFVPVDSNGIVSLEALKSLASSKTALIAAMLVNNEIGVIQPVEAIAELAHLHGALMLCDAVQGYGRVAIPDNVDMIAISGHKIYGPKGIGALWTRAGLELPTLIHGGGQEKGVRSGTLSPALCVGFGKAAELCNSNLTKDMAHIEKLSDYARELFGDWLVNGAIDRRYPGNLNLRKNGLDVGRLMSDVRDVAFSAGSACASGSGRPSHVLTALRLEPAEVRSSIRLGFGRYTTMDEIEQAANMINSAAKAQLL
ncbi:MAG: cysteine desulfurase family protein [Parasphingorhabdus sp.]|uniref:cysteine desulfurase family protein n=1 Tax=Parasphingorhabdus sp. TaxID=2709688 RepID=UPI00329848C1